MVGKIAVIGDIILDAYHLCKTRENLESSAPCYTVEKTEYKPGGAGNVAANLARLGTDCSLISIVGEDEGARRLEEMLNEFGVKSSLIKDAKRPTIVKERYLSSADGRYHFRADFEKKEYIDESYIDGIVARTEGYDTILISDYNKGLISRALVDRLKERDVRIIADTKPVHKDFFKGIFLIKPNIKEVREMTRIDDELVAAKKLGEELGTNVLLTRGKDGMSYFGVGGERYDFEPAIPREKVFDVTGAGDTVIATFAHFLNKSYSIQDCVGLANKAGGISVQYPGCYQVSEKELGIKGQP